MPRKSLLLAAGEGCAETSRVSQTPRGHKRLLSFAIPRGAPLRVTSGPFAGMCGAFQSFAARRDQVVLLIDVLGKRVPLAVQRERVELAA